VLIDGQPCDHIICEDCRVLGGHAYCPPRCHHDRFAHELSSVRVHSPRFVLLSYYGCDVTWGYCLVPDSTSVSLGHLTAEAPLAVGSDGPTLLARSVATQTSPCAVIEEARLKGLLESFGGPMGASLPSGIAPQDPSRTFELLSSFVSTIASAVLSLRSDLRGEPDSPRS